MAFPTSPANGSITTLNGITYTYSAATTSWTRQQASSSAGVFNVTTDTFISDGATVSYSLSTTPTSADVIFINIGGVLQQESAYTITGNQITFTGIPILGTTIEIRTFTASKVSVISGISYNSFTGDGSTTTYTLSTTPTNVNYIMAYINGIGQAKSSFSTSSGQITFSQAPPNTSLIEITVFGPAVASGYASGSNTQVQFNSNGIMASSANFTFTNSSNTLYSDNITALGANIGNLTITGSITGNLSSSTGTTTLGNLTVSTSATANVLTVTNGLTSNTLTINNSANLGAVSGLKITGGSANYVLTTDGTGNLTWKVGPTPQAQGGNTQIQYNSNSALAGSTTFTFNPSTNLVTASAFAGDGGNLSNITGANISGYVPVANTVLSVPGSNVTGTVNYSGYVTGNAQPNITSIGTLTGLVVAGNSSLTGNLTVAGGVTSLGVIGNLKITGGSNGQALITDGTGNLTFGNVAASGGGGASANLAIGYSLIFGG